MTANELRIGNWVSYTNDNGTFNLQVEEIRPTGIITIWNGGSWFVSFDKLKGIPLTEEILLKAGFEIGGYNFVEVTHPRHPRLFFVIGNNFDSIWWNYNIQGTSKECESSQIEIKYLHQLQNLFFALTGEEIKIEV